VNAEHELVCLDDLGAAEVPKCDDATWTRDADTGKWAECETKTKCGDGLYPGTDRDNLPEKPVCKDNLGVDEDP
jgi:hypothetical protein